MNGDRYVVVGLAHVRSSWFTEVARWATAGSLPVEFVKCLSPEELRVRLASGRPFSAALVDGRLPAVDRDLLATLTDLGIPSLVVQSASDDRFDGGGQPDPDVRLRRRGDLHLEFVVDASWVHPGREEREPVLEPSLL